MLITSKVTELLEWLDVHRPDPDSGKPYVIPTIVEGGYQLENDRLIVQGLEALGQAYTVSTISLSMTKLYFSTIEERDAFNAAEAEFAGADPSVPYLEVGQDELGYYLLVDVIAKPSLLE